MIQGEAPASGVRVEVHAPPAVLYVNGDAGMLRQAILNLALNACQAMPGGGVLRFGTRRASKSRVELSVEDTGTGIQPEHLQRIFDLYFTTRPKGTGIGLSMVYRYCAVAQRRHRGPVHAGRGHRVPRADSRSMIEVAADGGWMGECRA